MNTDLENAQITDIIRRFTDVNVTEARNTDQSVKVAESADYGLMLG